MVRNILALCTRNNGEGFEGRRRLCCTARSALDRKSAHMLRQRSAATSSSQLNYWHALSPGSWRLSYPQSSAPVVRTSRILTSIPLHTSSYCPVFNNPDSAQILETRRSPDCTSHFTLARFSKLNIFTDSSRPWADVSWAADIWRVLDLYLSNFSLSVTVAFKQWRNTWFLSLLV